MHGSVFAPQPKQLTSPQEGNKQDSSTFHLPQEHQAAAFENCWRKDWQDKEAHLLPAKHLSA